ncbi:Predicted PurR-regulated permease PerM [Cnuella takakiae]|uniref:Predicted PurR-regulated permease PerM n=1 Tax=Cnuella takakiae TaxID=1302690 RepID=A0A1M5IXU3_9BACT|nr:AI-2E family transporter [Cnuella takakiae]OLY91418.1 AI-2E family transporter [Cnuella takakiae]SHG33142.1 Predicted PurR-regulated permease PerM [Cnuella takakiae]
MRHQKVIKAAAIFIILIAIVVILVYAKPFLVPVTFGALLAMVLLPITKWLQHKGVGHALAIILSMLVLVAFFALVIFFISWQVSDIASNASQLEQQLTSKYQQAQQFIAKKMGVPVEQQQQLLKKQQQSSSGQMGTMITGFLSGLGGFLTNTLLVLVYIFLFTYFRERIKGFIVRLVPKEQEGNAVDTVSSAQKVAQKYLGGLALMVAFLWVMYAIGFTIAGVKNAIFFAIICGLLEIVPFVGNLTGTALTLTMSLVQGGGMNIVIGILVTYGLVQFIQTYILEPLVVGAEVSINPLFTIIGLVAGELVWGIPGMILAIPLMGIAKIVCDHVEPLKPYSYLIGEDKKKGEESGFKKKMKQAGEKIKGWFR